MAVILPETTPRSEFVTRMRAAGVEAGALSYALDTLASVGVSAEMPVARSLVARGASIPLYPDMSEHEQDHVLRAIEASL